MNLYSRKRKWKWLLGLFALLIFGSTIFYTDHLVRQIKEADQKNLHIWADAVNRKAALVNYTENFFRQIQEEERRRVELLAEAYKRLILTEDQADLTFYLNMLENNKTIPVLLTDQDQNILSATNIDIDLSKTKKLEGELLQEFTKYPPIEVPYMKGKRNYLYYTDSRLFSELHEVLNDLNQSFISEVVLNAASVPALIIDSTRTHILAYGNIESTLLADSASRQKIIHEMLVANKPIPITLTEHGKCLVIYRNSYLMNQLKYYPFIQLGIIGLFLLVAYSLFSSARKSEEDQVWVGMAKETAHQLGTPMSSMLAWMELMRMDGLQHPAIDEMGNDLIRLETITERFSKIGSQPHLEPANILEVVSSTLDYLKPRTSKKIHFVVNNLTQRDELYVPLNIPLFEWVIENLVKNAIDAMGGAGTFSITIQEDQKHVILDFSDTGKGIPRSQHKVIFKPGYSSKKRGWGLGLTLTRRIVHSYHKGKIFVKSSQLNGGTTFRVILSKKK
jgi:two-component sensor histidine kinase